MTTMIEWPDNAAVREALHATLEATGFNEPEKRYGILVMLSGGIDSVAVLANVLAETDHRVHAHHIELANRERREQAENDAVADVIDYCWRNYRDFNFSSSRSEFRITPRGYDLIITMFHAALVCMSSESPIDIVMTGHYQTRKLRIVYGDQMLHSCFLRNSEKPTWVRPLDALPRPATIKADIYRSVPPELAEMSWSCRKPVVRDGAIVPCARCYACRNLEAARHPA